MIRYFLLGFLAFTFYLAAQPVRAQPASCDKECVTTIRSLLEQQKHGISVSWLERANSRLGDSVSVGVQKIFAGRNIASPKNVRPNLPILVQAFRSPEMITDAENKSPTSTIKLLDTLSRDLRDAYLREEIIRTRDAILNLTKQATSKTQAHSRNMTDAEVIEALASDDRDLVERAVSEVMLGGERLIPLFVKLKGDRRCFAAIRKLGEWGPGNIRFDPRNRELCAKDPDAITVEVAALFLISAIYYNDLEFATPPSLCDRASPHDNRGYRCAGDKSNTRERVEKAWIAVEKWISEIETNGIESLRERKRDPLAGSEIAFY